MPPQELNDYLTAQNVGSIGLERTRASIAAAASPQETRARRNAENITGAIDALNRRIQQTERSDDWIGGLLKFNNTLVLGLVVTQPVLGIAAGGLLRWVEHEFEASANQGLRKAADVGLAKLRREMSAQQWSAFHADAVAGRAQMVEQTARQLLGPQFDSIENDLVRDKIQNEVISQIAGLVAEGAAIDSEQQRELRAIAKDLGEIQVARDRLAEKSEEAGTKAAAAQAPEALLGQTPAEAAQLPLEVTQMANTVAEQAKAASDILNRLGLPAAAKTASQVAGIATLIVGAAQIGTNPTALLPAISAGMQLLGINQGDPDAIDRERFEAVIARLDYIIDLLKAAQKQLLERLATLSYMLGLSLSLDAQILRGNLPLAVHLIPTSKLDDDGAPDYRKDLSFASYDDLAQHYARYAGRHVRPALEAVDRHFTPPTVAEDDEVSMHFRLVPTGTFEEQEATNSKIAYLYDIAMFARTYLESEFLSLLPAISQDYLVLRAKLNAETRRPSRFFLKYLPHALNPRVLERAVSFLLASHGYYEVTNPDGSLKSREQLMSPGTDPSLEGLARLETALAYIDVCLAQQSLFSGDVVLPLLHAHAFSTYSLIQGAVLHDPQVTGTFQPREVDKILRWYYGGKYIKAEFYASEDAGHTMERNVREAGRSLFRKNPTLFYNCALFAVRRELEFHQPAKTIEEYEQRRIAAPIGDPRYQGSAFWPLLNIPISHTSVDNEPFRLKPGYYFKLPVDPFQVDSAMYLALNLPTAETLKDAKFAIDPAVPRLIHLRQVVSQQIGAYSPDDEGGDMDAIRQFREGLLLEFTAH